MDGHAFDDDDTSSEEDEGFLEDFADASSRRAGDAGPSDAHGQYTSAFVNHKAGMDGVDKAHVRRVVDEMSKNSAHYRNENRKEEKVEAKIREMRAAHARLTPEHLARIQRDVDARVKTLEKMRDVSRTWIHVDMDAFYAAVHTLENPSLARIPIAVGGIGMISTANYVARTFGVRSAMPGFIAKKLCPHLTFVTPDFPKYRRYAELAREVFREFDADFDAVSLDEAFLDVTEYLETRGVDASAAAADLRAKVRAKTSGLTCSAGVAPNRRLAKVCSDMNKPDGQMVLASDRDQILRLVNPLPVRKVGGVGKVNERVLAAFGMSTCGDVFAKRAVVAALFSKSAFTFLLEASMGVGTERRRNSRALLPGTQVARKSLGQEKTFAPTADRRVQDLARHRLARRGGCRVAQRRKPRRARGDVENQTRHLRSDAEADIVTPRRELGRGTRRGVAAPVPPRDGSGERTPRRRQGEPARRRGGRDGRRKTDARGCRAGRGGGAAQRPLRRPLRTCGDVRVRVRAGRRGGGPRRARGLALRAGTAAARDRGGGRARFGALERKRRRPRVQAAAARAGRRESRRQAEDAVRRLPRGRRIKSVLSANRRASETSETSELEGNIVYRWMFF